MFAAHLLGRHEVGRPAGGDVTVRDVAEHLGAVGVDVLGLVDQRLGPRLDVLGDVLEFLTHIRRTGDGDIAVIGEHQKPALGCDIGAHRVHTGLHRRDRRRGFRRQLRHGTDHRGVVENLAGGLGDLAAGSVGGWRLPPGESGDQL